MDQQAKVHKLLLSAIPELVADVRGCRVVDKVGSKQFSDSGGLTGKILQASQNPCQRTQIGNRPAGVRSHGDVCVPPGWISCMAIILFPTDAPFNHKGDSWSVESLWRLPRVTLQKLSEAMLPKLLRSGAATGPSRGAFKALRTNCS